MARQSLLGGALVASCLLTWHCAAAQSPSDAEKLKRLERQAELLQKQMNRQNDLIGELQQEVTRARKKSEKKETEVARRSEPSVNSKGEERHPSATVHETSRAAELSRTATAAPPPYVPTTAEIIRGTQPAVPTPAAQFGGVQFSVWGWLEAATVFRNHNSVNDMLTVFGAIPYPYSPLLKNMNFTAARGRAKSLSWPRATSRFEPDAEKIRLDISRQLLRGIGTT
ncbi:hypothetical protein ACVWWO_007385 [Bradyrhizobium sp. F1.13.1]